MNASKGNLFLSEPAVWIGTERKQNEPIIELKFKREMRVGPNSFHVKV
jgi:hypothetical protein